MNASSISQLVNPQRDPPYAIRSFRHLPQTCALMEGRWKNELHLSVEHIRFACWLLDHGRINGPTS
jgi:hypothetical protein